MANAAPTSVDHYFEVLESCLDKCAAHVNHDMETFLTNARKVGEAVLHIAAADTPFAAHLVPVSKKAQGDVARDLLKAARLDDIVIEMLAVIRVCGNRGAHVQAPNKKPDATVEAACICSLLVIVNWLYQSSGYARQMSPRVARAQMTLAEASRSPVRSMARDCIIAELESKLDEKTSQLENAKAQLGHLQSKATQRGRTSKSSNLIVAGLIAVISAGLAATVAVIVLPRTVDVGEPLSARVHEPAPANADAAKKVTARAEDPRANSQMQDALAVAPGPLFQADATVIVDTESAANPDVAAPIAERDVETEVEPAAEPKAAVARCPPGTNLVDAAEFKLSGGPPDRKHWGKPLLKRPPEEAVAEFCLDAAPVTTERFRRALAGGKLASLPAFRPVPGSNLKLGVKHHPINFVTWVQAAEFCRTQGGTLPTIAQWEVAANKLRALGFAKGTSEWADDSFPPKAFGFRAADAEECKSGVRCRHLYHGQLLTSRPVGVPRLSWNSRGDGEPALPNISFRCAFKPDCVLAE